MSLCFEKVCNSGFDSAVTGYAADLHVQKVRTYCQIWTVHGKEGIAIVMNLNIGSH